MHAEWLWIRHQKPASLRKVHKLLLTNGEIDEKSREFLLRAFDTQEISFPDYISREWKAGRYKR